jgi:hypothetical protein
LNVEDEEKEDPETAVPRFVGEIQKALREIYHPK